MASINAVDTAGNGRQAIPNGRKWRGCIHITKGSGILISILFLSSCRYVRGLELATSKTAVVTDLTQVPRALLPDPFFLSLRAKILWSTFLLAGKTN